MAYIPRMEWREAERPFSRIFDAIFLRRYGQNAHRNRWRRADRLVPGAGAGRRSRSGRHRSRSRGRRQLSPTSTPNSSSAAAPAKKCSSAPASRTRGSSSPRRRSTKSTSWPARSPIAWRARKPSAWCRARTSFPTRSSCRALKQFGINRVLWPEAQLAADIEGVVTAPGAIDAESFAGGLIRLLEYRLEATSTSRQGAARATAPAARLADRRGETRRRAVRAARQDAAREPATRSS